MGEWRGGEPVGMAALTCNDCETEVEDSRRLTCLMGEAPCLVARRRDWQAL